MVDHATAVMLTEENMRLVPYMVHRYFGKETDMLDDYIATGYLGLWKAARKFEPDQGVKFGTYASRCIVNEIMMLVRKESRQTKAISLDMEISISNGSAASKVRLYEVIPCPDEGPDDLAEQQIAILEMYNALHRLPEQYRSILCLRYGLGASREMNQRCIAREFGVTPQHMSRKLRTALSRLRIIMES